MNRILMAVYPDDNDEYYTGIIGITRWRRSKNGRPDDASPGEDF